MSDILSQTKPSGNHDEVAEKSATDPAESRLSQFDPSRLRLSQDFNASIGVKKALLTVPCRKPSKEAFIQTHPSEEYRVQTAVLELKEDREIYLVDPELWAELSTESTFGPRAIFTAITRQGVVFLWPIRLPGPDGKLDDWNQSALDAAGMAQSSWIRVASNMHLGAYEMFEASANLPAPEWPDVPFAKLLEVSFGKRYVKDLDHPVLKKLRGEA